MLQNDQQFWIVFFALADEEQCQGVGGHPDPQRLCFPAPRPQGQRHSPSAGTFALR